MDKNYVKAVVIRQDPVARGIFSLWLSCPEIAENAKSGQFVGVYSNDASRLLPRPISICEIDKADGAIRLVYRVAGAGTEEFSGLHTGDLLRLIGPLGNGYPISEEYKAPILIGGGIGIPPILQLSKDLSDNEKKTVVLGYRKELFLTEEFEHSSKRVCMATEDGSAGVRGTVIDAIACAGVEGDVVYACGPMPMLKAVAEYADKNGIPAYLSLEERMACGVGACLGCIVKTKEKDAHSNVNNARICTEGPVFKASDIQW